MGNQYFCRHGFISTTHREKLQFRCASEKQTKKVTLPQLLQILAGILSYFSKTLVYVVFFALYCQLASGNQMGLQKMACLPQDCLEHHKILLLILRINSQQHYIHVLANVLQYCDLQFYVYTYKNLNVQVWEDYLTDNQQPTNSVSIIISAPASTTFHHPCSSLYHIIINQFSSTNSFISIFSLLAVQNTVQTMAHLAFSVY